MALPSLAVPSEDTKVRIESALQAAAAMDAVARVEGGQRLAPDQLHKLLYYVQGITMAMEGNALFAGRFVAAAQGPVVLELADFVEASPKDWWIRLKNFAPSFHDRGWDRIREVYLAFGRLNAFEMTQSAKSESPWIGARAERPWYDRSMPDMPDRDIKSHFAEMVEFGEDALADLGVRPNPGQPEWLAPYKTSVLLKYLFNHPFFVEAEARRLRSSLRFPEVPENWDEVDFSPTQKTGPDDTLRQ